jgi:hypothetical protein
MNCGTRSEPVTSLWDPLRFSTGGPTAANGISDPFWAVLPVIHTPMYYDKRFFK